MVMPTLRVDEGVVLDHLIGPLLLVVVVMIMMMNGHDGDNNDNTDDNDDVNGD